VNPPRNALCIGKWLLHSVCILLLVAGTNLHGQEGLQVSSRTVKKYVRPAFPGMARQMKLKGTVRLEVVISPAGRVASVKLVGGHPLLALSATQAVKAWVFAPGPAETTEMISISFEEGN
jgi:TonB family protein